MDFNRVLVTDRLAWELFGAAAREGFLFSRGAGAADLPKRAGLARQRALSLLVLFERLVVHDFGDAFRLPDLENSGLVEVVPALKPADNVPPVPTRWQKAPLSLASRPDRELLRNVSRIREFRPLVINRLLVGFDFAFFDALAEGLRVSRRQCLELFFDYAIAAVQGDTSALAEHVFSAALPEDFLRQVTTELFDFSSRGEESPEPYKLCSPLRHHLCKPNRDHTWPVREARTGRGHGTLWRILQT